MDLSLRPVHNPAVLTRKIVDGEMVLVNADNAVSLALTNQTAVVVWELANDKNSVLDIIDEVKRRFEDVPDTVTDDTIALLELLTRDGFIGFERVRET